MTEQWKFSRENAFFDGSRLYRQAAEASTGLWQALAGEDFLQRTMDELTVRDSPRHFRSREDVLVATGALREAIAERIGAMSAYHALPTLFQVVADAYTYRDGYPFPPAVVVAPAKIVAIRIARASAGGAAGTRSASRDLLDCLLLAIGEYQLNALLYAYAIAPDGDAVMAARGFRTDEAMGSVLTGFRYAFASGGLVQRFAGSVTELMFARPSHYLWAAIEVLSGTSPKAVPAFAGTYLAELPGRGEAATFWCQLAVRLQLLALSQGAAAAVSDRPDRITILGDSPVILAGEPISRLPTKHATQLTKEIEECFWQGPWLRSIRPGREATEFVRRPITRIASPPDKLYVTSSTNIADSITTLVESAVGPTRSTTTPLLPAKVHTRLLTRPFEMRVIEALRGHGYWAGEVSTAGAWMTQHGNLHDRATGKPGGQIDLLAWHPSGDTIVADCKVLQLPEEVEAIRNVWAKLGPADNERFRAKLRRNSAWCARFLARVGKQVTRVRSALILDRGFHFLQPDDDVEVIDLTMLDEWLSGEEAP